MIALNGNIRIVVRTDRSETEIVPWRGTFELADESIYRSTNSRRLREMFTLDVYR